MWETWVRSLGWEDPLEEGMETHSSILAWRIPMDRGAWQDIARGVAQRRIPLSDRAQHKGGLLHSLLLIWSFFDGQFGCFYLWLL